MRRALTALFLTALLCGCGTWVVDSQVRSFSKLGAVPAGATYRFERLPSQQADETVQQSVEAMAGAALDKVGLRRDDANARYSAQVDARVTQVLSPVADPWMYGPAFYRPGAWGAYPYGYGPGWGAWGGWGAYGNLPPASNPWYLREVSVLLREIATGQVVYETRARNDGPYNRSAAIFPVMFDAALQGFPNPPEGQRRVDIPLAPKK
ncbi:MAG: DUF4136 domain-containing protein [Comamonadaceae bacterium]|nr:MAG: DUF4136 domain-containing protein [Comamonadaceae bacterium]